MKHWKAACIQMEHADGDKNKNLKKIRGFCEEARQQDVDLAVFPECCITGYWFLRTLSRTQLNDLAEPIPLGPSTQTLLRWASDYQMAIGAGLVEKDESGRLYNAYVLAMPDGTVHTHRKIHTFISEHMTSGDTYTVFDTPLGCKMGILTCYDNNIVENVRITALMGAKVILAPHQTGGCDSPDPRTMGLVDKEKWEKRAQDKEAIEAELSGLKGRGWLMRWLPSRAHDNGVYVLFSNGIGVDHDEIRTGHAMILDPYGDILAETGKAADDMVVAPIDLAVHDISTGRRWITTRRPELYEQITRKTGLERDTRQVRFDKKGV